MWQQASGSSDHASEERTSDASSGAGVGLGRDEPGRRLTWAGEIGGRFGSQGETRPVRNPPGFAFHTQPEVLFRYPLARWETDESLKCVQFA